MFPNELIQDTSCHSCSICFTLYSLFKPSDVWEMNSTNVSLFIYLRISPKRKPNSKILLKIHQLKETLKQVCITFFFLKHQMKQLNG